MSPPAAPPPAPAAWTFSTRPAARRADVVLAAFGVGPRAEAPLDRAAAGIPASVDLARHEVRTIARGADPGWFDAWRTGSLRAIAAQDLGADLAALDAADHVTLVAVRADAPADLGYLQAAWGLARHLVARGATLVLDVHAMTYHRGAALPAPDAGLDVAREVRRVYETSAARATAAHALHTRGLRKFGAPDLIALCADADARLVGRALGELADAVARGVDLGAPRHAVQIAPGVTWYAVADEHGLADLLQLGNAARVLVDEAGHDLVGVLGRLPRGAG